MLNIFYRDYIKHTMTNFASKCNKTTRVTCKHDKDKPLKLKASDSQENNCRLDLNDLPIDADLNDFFSRKDKKKNKKNKKKISSL